MAKFFFAAGEVSFDRAERPGKECGDFLVRKPLTIAEVQRELFVGAEVLQGGREVVCEVEPSAGRRRVVGMVAVEFVMFALTALSVAPVIVGDAEEPSGECRRATELWEVAVGGDEGVLRKIVGEGGVAAREVTEEVAHAGLMPKDEFAEGRAIVMRNGAADELGVGKVHGGAAGARGSGRLFTAKRGDDAEEQHRKPDESGNGADKAKGAHAETFEEQVEAGADGDGDESAADVIAGGGWRVVGGIGCG